jgi:hypothetical protein
MLRMLILVMLRMVLLILSVWLEGGGRKKKRGGKKHYPARARRARCLESRGRARDVHVMRASRRPEP